MSQSPALLPAKRVRRVLEEANRYGVAASVLITADGSLLCSAGFDSLTPLTLEPHTVGAIAANVWGYYAAAGAHASAGAARTMLCELEGGMLGVCAACDSKCEIYEKKKREKAFRDADAIRRPRAGI